MMDQNILVRKLEGYAPLKERSKQILRDLSERQVSLVDAGSVIIEDGDKPDDICLIVEGWAARYKVSHEGGRRIMAFLLPGDFCELEIAVLEQMDHAIMALTPCKVARLDSEAVKRILAEDPALADALRWMTLVEGAILRQWVVNGRRQASAAFAHLLCELYIRMKSIGLLDGDRLLLPLTQEELTDALGLSTVHTNRTLQRLRERGLIELEGGILAIPDFAALADAGGFDDNYLHRRSSRADSLSRPRSGRWSAPIDSLSSA
ncbi:MAG: Crp/Fnr family transcriptional regulator [Erythrobacter sp.]